MIHWWWIPIAVMIGAALAAMVLYGVMAGRRTDVLEVRQEILQFARVMERKLREGEARRGPWKGADSTYLVRRINQERDELLGELWRPGGVNREAVIGEAADLANTGFMTAVVIGGLMEEETERKCRWCGTQPCPYPRDEDYAAQLARGGDEWRKKKPCWTPIEEVLK